MIERTLQEIEAELELEPWNVERDKLIRYFEELRSGGSDELAVPQDMANQTIENIVELVETSVIEKLRAVMAVPETSERLANYPDKVQGAGEIRQQVRKALSKMSPKSAEIFALRYFEGYGNHEIARMLGTSRSTVNVILHRARQRLKEEIRGYLGEGQ